VGQQAAPQIGCTDPSCSTQPGHTHSRELRWLGSLGDCIRRTFGRCSNEIERDLQTSAVAPIAGTWSSARGIFRVRDDLDKAGSHEFGGPSADVEINPSVKIRRVCRARRTQQFFPAKPVDFDAHLGSRGVKTDRKEIDSADWQPLYPRSGPADGRAVECWRIYALPGCSPLPSTPRGWGVVGLDTDFNENRNSSSSSFEVKGGNLGGYWGGDRKGAQTREIAPAGDRRQAAWACSISAPTEKAGPRRRGGF